MSQLTADQVRHIAKLARLNVSDEEVKKLATELTSILGYIDQLSEVKTDGVSATEQVTGTSNILREDVILEPRLASPDALLATSSLPIIDHQIETPSAHASTSSAQVDSGN